MINSGKRRRQASARIGWLLAATIAYLRPGLPVEYVTTLDEVRR